jgi:hypothetical protein
VHDTNSTRRSYSSGMDMSPRFELQKDDYLKETITENFDVGGGLGSALSQFGKCVLIFNLEKYNQ